VGTVAAASVVAASPPAIFAAHAGAFSARVTSLVGCPAASAPAPAPSAVSFAASAALGEGGEGSHLSGGARHPSLSSSSSSSDDEYSEVLGEESPCCSRNQNSSLLCSRRSRRRMLRSFLRAARSCSRCCAARSRARARAWAGRTVWRSRPSLLMVKIRQPSHEFTLGVGISFIPYPLVLTPVI
jgi:hypothetical protein